MGAFYRPPPLGNSPGGYVPAMDHDDALDVGVRVGLVSYGIVHLLMAWLAVQLVFGDREGNVSGTARIFPSSDGATSRLTLLHVESLGSAGSRAGRWRAT